MAEFINTIDVLGDEVVMDSLISKTITEFADNVLTKVGSYGFAECRKLKTVDLPNLTQISEGGFASCTVLKTLILRATDTVCTLSNTNAFVGTYPLKNAAIADKTGYIYVPAALVDSYKAATNWSTFANQFRALEDYTVDGTVTGALDESKI